MTEHVAHRETVGRYTVTIYFDTHHELADAVNDEPAMIFGRERGGNWQVLSQSKRKSPSMDILRAIEEKATHELLNLLTDMRYSDWGQADSGRFWADHPDWQTARNHSGRRYYKTKDAMAAALFEAEHGHPLADLKVEQFGDYRSTFYLCFWQSELDAYAGCKNAVSCRESCQSIVDGDVYGFRITGPAADDEDGDELDSCWGFIGDMNYCLSEAKSIAERMEARARERDACDMAAAIMESRPDLAPQYV
jgi:hypothetical protein